MTTWRGWSLNTTACSNYIKTPKPPLITSISTRCAKAPEPINFPLSTSSTPPPACSTSACLVLLQSEIFAAAFERMLTAVEVQFLNHHLHRRPACCRTARTRLWRPTAAVFGPASVMEEMKTLLVQLPLPWAIQMQRPLCVRAAPARSQLRSESS